MFEPGALAAWITQHYPLTNVRCELMKPGINDSYRVWSDQADAVLRVSPVHVSLATVAAEVSALAVLHSNGVPVITAYPSAGRLALPINAPEGERAAVLFTLASGVPLSAAQTLENVRAYGEALARFHLTADTLPIEYWENRPRWDAAGLVDMSMHTITARLSASHPAAVMELQAVAEAVRDALATFPTDAPLYGAIHADTDASNVFVGENGQLTLIDFDYMGVGLRVYDLACFVDELRVYWPKRENYEGAFIEGYARVRKIEAVEREILPYLLAARKLFVLSLYTRHIDIWGRFRLSDRYISGIVNRAKSYLV